MLKEYSLFLDGNFTVISVNKSLLNIGCLHNEINNIVSYAYTLFYFDFDRMYKI